MNYTFFYSLIVWGVSSVDVVGVTAAFSPVPLVSVGRDASFDSKIHSQSPVEDEVTAAPMLPAREDLAPKDNDEFEPVCRVVASSDNKLPHMVASKLSQSSASLLKKLDLLYTAQSKKEMRDLAYLKPDSTLHDNSISLHSMGASAKSSDVCPESKLISVLKRALDDGGFKLMDQRDLDLCSALNAGYLLRLSLLPDLNNLGRVGEEFYPLELSTDGDDSDPMKQLILDGKVLIFRRGYTEEVTKGRLLLPKLDYLQTSLVQGSTRLISRKLGEYEGRLEEFTMKIVSQLDDTIQDINKRLIKSCSDMISDILDSFGLSNNAFVANMMSKNATVIFTGNRTLNGSGSLSSNIPLKTANNVRVSKIFKLNRYEVGTLLDTTDVSLSSFLLCDLNNEMSSIEREIYDAIDAGKIDSASMYKTSTVRLLERVSIANTVDFFSKKGRRKLVKNYFKSCTLLEPSYEEVVVIWRPSKKNVTRKQPPTPPKWMYEVAAIFEIEDKLPKIKNATPMDDDDKAMPPLEIKVFNNVPMANILAVLPKNKLIFRPADAFVFDLVSLTTFLVTAGSIKFDSPKLDLLALVSVTLFAVRTVSTDAIRLFMFVLILFHLHLFYDTHLKFFRYSNKYARYDLLVNKFLTSKLSHRGPGALNYLVQEANSQKALRAMCIRDWLCLRKSKNEVISLDEGEAYINDKAFSGKARISVDISSGLDDLILLRLLTSSNELINDEEAPNVLKRVWDNIFED